MPYSFLIKKLLVRSGIAKYLPITRRLTAGGNAYIRYYSDQIIAAPVEKLLDPRLFPALTQPTAINLNQSAPEFDSPVSGGRVSADRFGNPHPLGLPELRTALSDGFAAQDGRTLDPSCEVLVTHGATGAYAAVLNAFVNPGDRVVLLDPCSPLFSLGAESRRAKIVRVPTWIENGRLRFDRRVLLKAMSGAMLLAVADPGNPFGGMVDQEDWEFIAAAARRRDVLIHLDESFSHYRFAGKPAPLSGLKEAKDRTLSAGSLTYGHGLGSTRVGWLTGPRHLIAVCGLSQNLAAPYVPTICQQIAVRALGGEEDQIQRVVAQARSKRQYVFDRLSAMGLSPAMPAGGLFFWIDVSSFGLTGRAFAEKLYRDGEVMVGPGDAFGPSGIHHVRIGFALEDGRLREGLSRLASFVARERGEPMIQSVSVNLPEISDRQVSLEDKAPGFSRV